MRVVVDHRSPEAGRLADPHVARDHGLEHQAVEVLADLALDVLRQAGAPVVHRQQHPGHRQPRVQFALDQGQGVQQAGKPLEREILRLDGDDHAICRDKRAHRQRAERRRTVEQRERVALPDRFKRVPEPGLGPGDPRQFDRRSSQVWTRRRDPQMVDSSREDRLLERHVAD